MFVSAEFLFDFPFKNFSFFWPAVDLGSVRNAQFNFPGFLSDISLRREQIDGSKGQREKGQRAYVFVNERNEFSRINCFASLFGIIRNLPY